MGPLPELPDLKLILGWGLFGIICAICLVVCGVIWLLNHVVIV